VAYTAAVSSQQTSQRFAQKTYINSAAHRTLPGSVSNVPHLQVIRGAVSPGGTGEDSLGDDDGRDATGLWTDFWARLCKKKPSYFGIVVNDFSRTHL